MAFQVTVLSARECLDEQGSRCPVVTCGSTRTSVTAEPGSDSECSKEHFVCRDCTTEWTVYLYAAQIISVMLENGRRLFPSIHDRPDSIEPGVFDQIPCPKGPIADALNEFLKQMRMGSVQGKGEALAKLAHLARVDLSSLNGNQPVELPTLPSDTE